MSELRRDDDCCRSGRQESLTRIYHYLDGELSGQEISAIREHIDTCHDCREEYAVEALLKELVRRSCCNDAAPDGLKERIRARIVMEQTTITVHRRMG
ncbi:mycothiol system anti-sigma-R factor [Brevibacterium pityocampae]|uniref:Mycothiol system anti-sigma-R factor n=1 Tax=Brevibacterium pityocampae TaxID=506594 RepID=A0ABP8JIV9_9MICO